MMQLYNIMTQHQNHDFEMKLEFLESSLMSQDNYSREEQKIMKTKIQTLKSRFRRRWQLANRRHDLFLKQNHNWLRQTVTVPKPVNKQGRPRKLFEELSERTKRKRTEDIRANSELEELQFATESKLRMSGQLEASKILKDIRASPGRAKKLRTAYVNAENNKREQLSTLDAVQKYIDADLSRRQYEIIRSCDRTLFPSYKKLRHEMGHCYPKPEAFHVTDRCAEVNLQDLLNHTATRLVKYLEGVLPRLEENQREIELISKWGCDGSQQVEYKQKFENENDSDAQIFQTSMLPLRLICGKKIIWKNPSSPHYCRPIRIIFQKETPHIIRDEIDYIQKQIDKLTNTQIDESAVSIKHTMMLAMVDGKVCNAATNTVSTTRCYICGATSKDFNNLLIKKPVDPNAIKFGLSTLHARIRFFESLLHLSYKLPIQKWQVRTEADKNIVKETKRDIQDKFRKEMGLLVDMPKQGYGNSNDGNTSRRFFRKPEISARITGVDIRLIRRFKVILEVISSGHKINVEKFGIYTMDTAKLYVQLYSWYPMTPAVHKVLIHGPLVIQDALVPIGQLSEEAIEARNKYVRNYRLNHARKFSREGCNMEVLKRLLVTSDPLISSLRKKIKKKSEPYTKEVTETFLPISEAEEEEEEEDTDEETDEESFIDS